jgi:hypothetical protein
MVNRSQALMRATHHREHWRLTDRVGVGPPVPAGLPWRISFHEKIAKRTHRECLTASG